MKSKHETIAKTTNTEESQTIKSVMVVDELQQTKLPCLQLSTTNAAAGLRQLATNFLYLYLPVQWRNLWGSWGGGAKAPQFKISRKFLWKVGNFSPWSSIRYPTRKFWYLYFNNLFWKSWINFFNFSFFVNESISILICYSFTIHVLYLYYFYMVCIYIQSTLAISNSHGKLKIVRPDGVFR